MVNSPSGFSNLIWLSLLVSLSIDAQAQWHSARQNIMGTVVDVEVWHEEPSIALNGIEKVFEEMHRIDRHFSPHKSDSQLSYVNQYAAAEDVSLDAETFFILSKAQQISILTKGAFDVTFASVGFLYDFRNRIKPTFKQRAQSLSAINYRHVQLKEDLKSVRFLNSAVKIDLGGIAKGYACDRAVLLLMQLGIKHAMVSAGGDSKLLGDRLDRPWMIGIKNPRGENTILSIPIEDVAISTSGDYERFFDDNGVRYHHIIDPSNGDSARELRSVTIIANEGVLSDGLSTGVFVLGLEAGLALINRLEGVSAILIDAVGGLHYSEDLEGL